jgi:hypothetical protein
MSLIADLVDIAMVDPTVHAALQRLRIDPALTEYDVLVALVVVLAREKQTLGQALIDHRNRCTCQKITVEKTP